MTVKELIERLSLMPSDALVMVNGYEDGAAEVDLVSLDRAKMNVNAGRGYYGPHELDKNGDQIVVFIGATTRGS